jgi:hypothetical protein
LDANLLFILISVATASLVFLGTMVAFGLDRNYQLFADAVRSFRIPFGWTIPVLSMLIFSALGLAAGLTPSPLPLLITFVIFAVTLIYVRLYVTRLKAQARRQASRRRRPEVSKAAITGVSPASEADPTGRAFDEPDEQNSLLP